MTNKPLIELESVSFQYGDGPLVLKDISLNISESEFVALVGQNGAGKTTCAKLMNGILQPLRGRVTVAGTSTTEVATSTLAQTIGYCYQNPDHQIWALHVEEELAFGPENLGFSDDRVREQVEKALELADLVEQREEYTFALGWGQRQKLAVAAILAMRPKVIIVDEPTTGLDWDGSIRIMELLKSLNEQGMTVIIITHDIDIVARYARRVVVFADGEVVRDGEVQKVLRDEEALQRADLRPPQFIRVALALADYGIADVSSSEQLKTTLVSRLEETTHVNE
jgi:energy-coupling factor transporter ATP-binding protein EcfA2